LYCREIPVSSIGKTPFASRTAKKKSSIIIQPGEIKNAPLLTNNFAGEIPKITIRRGI
jgi:hypothetical protein